MSLVRNLRGFLQKERYDFGRPDIDLYNFHPQLFVLLAIQGIFTGQRDSYKRFIMPMFTIAVTIVGLILQALNLYAGVIYEDYSEACESFCYMVILGSAFSATIGFVISKDEALSLIEELNAGFVHVCSLGPRYRDPFLNSQLLVWKLFVGWSCFVIFVGTVFISYPTLILIYQSLFATQDEHLKRPLVFPIWLPNDDPYRTPNYETFYVIEMTYVVLFMFSFGVRVDTVVVALAALSSFDLAWQGLVLVVIYQTSYKHGYVYTLFHFLLHYYIMMDMIMLDFKVLFDDLDESVADLPRHDPRRIAVQATLNKRLGRIVTWHLSVFRAIKSISLVYRPSLVYHLMFSSIALCLMAWQIAETLDKGGFNFLFSMLATGAILQLWIPCYLGTLIRNKGFAVGDSCWNCGWHETSLGKMIRTDLVLILMRAQMPIFIKFTGQPVVQLETFSGVMSTSYSYFNMLRQSQNQ